MDKTPEVRLAALEERLGVGFNNRLLLVEALTHRSFLNECAAHPTGHNERLEFLGDAVVELIVTEQLYRKFPDKAEGHLTSFRAALVCADTLADVAMSCGLHEALFISRGQVSDNQSKPKAFRHICANAFEAVVAALFLDQGLGVCRLFLDRYLHVHLSRIISDQRDPKGKFQEDMQARFGLTPKYQVLREHGPDHAKTYVIGCYVGLVLVSQALGASKKEAEVDAARQAAETLKDWEGRITESCSQASAVRRSRIGGRR